MLNIYGELEGFEFKHNFDEIFEYGVEKGRFSSDKKEFWKKWWDYFSEAKTEQQMFELCKYQSDKRTRLGKWAEELRDRYEIDSPPRYKYKSFVKKELALNVRES